MIDYEKLITTIRRGLLQHLKCEVVQTNQTAEAPSYPFMSFTVITPMTENKGTYSEYEDNKARKPANCIISFTAQSNKRLESVQLANNARTWFDYLGTTHLNDNGVIVQSVGSVSNRDNLLTVGYEYKNGFDVTFWLYDEVEKPDIETIETITFDDNLSISGGE